jgi:hypothetical protein
MASQPLLGDLSKMKNEKRGAVLFLTSPWFLDRYLRVVVIRTKW